LAKALFLIISDPLTEANGNEKKEKREREIILLPAGHQAS
jgi:hypothetical protein